MKATYPLLTTLGSLALLGSLSPLTAQETQPQAEATSEVEVKAKLTPEQEAKHRKASDDLSLDQDDLGADVQEMIDLETNEKIVILFEEIETLMNEVTDQLEDAETGGETMAAESEIIERIFEAAKEKSQ